MAFVEMSFHNASDKISFQMEETVGQNGHHQNDKNNINVDETNKSNNNENSTHPKLSKTQESYLSKGDKVIYYLFFSCLNSDQICFSFLKFFHR
jgi:hypothetical protein